ncbi:protein Mpv17 [Zerene cesonia]|uniref:protein Mpv17 n=1 Tax=Zerene cesonia TaxID=33412 RepID=UPI0018E57E9B|nr:protein Mpv17 [Zerene cesonia]
MHVSIMKVREIFQFYQKLLNRRPYLVQAVQTGTLMGAGDIISQTLIEKKSLKEFDYSRTLKFSSIGFCFGGPALRVWYGLLNRHVGSSGKTVAMKKVFVDQVVFAPTFLFSLLVALGTLQGKKWDAIQNDINANYFDILKTNYYIWPWVQLVNFYYVPLQYQVLVVQSVALFWNTYLSYKTNRKTLIE